MTCNYPDLGSASDWMRQIPSQHDQSETLRYPYLGSDTSSVWISRTRFLHGISRGNQIGEMSAVSSGYFVGWTVFFFSTNQVVNFLRLSNQKHAL